MTVPYLPLRTYFGICAVLVQRQITVQMAGRASDSNALREPRDSDRGCVQMATPVKVPSLVDIPMPHASSQILLLHST